MNEQISKVKKIIKDLEKKIKSKKKGPLSDKEHKSDKEVLSHFKIVLKNLIKNGD